MAQVTARQNFIHSRENMEMRARREENVRMYMVRGLRGNQIARQLIRMQLTPAPNQQPVESFADPHNYTSCLRVVYRDIERIEKSIDLEYQRAIPNAAANVLAQLDAFIESGWQAFNSPSADPIKAAAGGKLAFDALLRKARLLRVDVDARWDIALDGDPLNIARMAAQKIAEVADALQHQLKPLQLSEPLPVITIESSNRTAQD